MSVLNEFLANVVREIINPLILLLSAGAFVVFVWGAFQLIAHAGDATKREQGRKSILWGVVGFAIIFGVYGILNIALATFGLDPVQKISQ
ncbi:MAG: hypothetical protein WC030_00360 [Candidatus Paceibacterota bacterium]